MKTLWCDLSTDDEKCAYLLSGRAYEAGIIAVAIQNDVAMAYNRCTQYRAALEAAEANFEESRADNYRMALELADMKREAAELRARVAELEGMVPKWVPVAERLPTKSCTVLVAFPSAFGGAIPTTRVAIYCAGVFTYPSSDMAIRDATHWMQYTLPAAPKEEV